MEDDMDYGKDMTLEELENLEEVNFEIDKSAFEVNGGVCRNCNGRLLKMVENRDIGNWVTLHFKKLKCNECSKEYLDLNNAEEYDLLLNLEKAFKQPINVLSQKISGLV
ncbi:hypothetical protein CMI42_02640 [Candidatus Pacearchaeota archaeon]|nr:hypothetical protein [Candidatus Pacearchaeota archaeon]|tara:strand:- start:832 stop:1158 length:327 start_codon:yes stop_codon:yes gene_type:complete